MGKRSDFKRKDRDFYPTPYEAVLPLIPHVVSPRYVEPCAGDGALINHLSRHNIETIYACDIEPRAEGINKANALDLTLKATNQIITNPPWDRKILHPMIEKFRMIAPTWLLFDADWMHTKQSSEYMKYCKKIVSVGRVKWIPDSKTTGKDNCAWYLLSGKKTETQYIGR